MLVPVACSNAKRQLKAALAERDAQVQRVNELTQQLQDKKRQLFSAIQVRGTGVGAHLLPLGGGMTARARRRRELYLHVPLSMNAAAAKVYVARSS